MKNQKGFSLIELLVVVIIIAIIAAIAIPSLLASRRAANQSATVANLRTVVSAEATYASLNQGNYATWTIISGNPFNMLDDTWTGATVTKNGYAFAQTNSTTVGYCVVATAAANSGDFHYAVSHQGVIYQAAATGAAPACDPATGIITGGTVLGG